MLSPERAAYAAKMRQYHMTGGMLPHFRSSVAFQRGRGIGGLLGSLVRRVIPFFSTPIVKKGIKHIGKAATTALLEAGQKALAEQEPFRKALKRSSGVQAQRLMSQAQSTLKAPPKSIKRPHPKKKVRVSFNPKRARRDIFT